MRKNNLTVRKVATVGPGKYADGAGLQLVVSQSGSRRWVFRFMLNGCAREMGLGGYPNMSLAAACDKAAEHRRKVKSGIDPIEEARAKAQAKPEKTPTFTRCAAQYILAHRNGWENTKHAHQWVRMLKTYVRPKIGTKPVDAIGTEDVLNVLKPIWDTKTETAKRVQRHIENVMDYAAAYGYRDQTNPARWRGHLDKLLPKPSRVKRLNRHPSMPYPEVPAFMVELAGNDSISALALRFLILTATRTSEALQAQWNEIDLETTVWTIPAEWMKARRKHRVPLSDAAMRILGTLPRIEDNPYLFPGARHGHPLSNMALLRLMHGMGYGVNGNRGDYVPHGFRSSFRDWSSEVSSFPRDVAEMALAHVIGNKVEAAYRRGDLFAKRCKMMQEWADYVYASNSAARGLVAQVAVVPAKTPSRCCGLSPITRARSILRGPTEKPWEPP